MCRPCRPRCSDGMGRFPVGLRASSFRKPTGRSGLQNEPSLSPRCPIGLLLSCCGHILFAPCRRTSTSGSDPAFGETNSSCGVSSVSPWPEMQDSMIGIVQMLGSSHHQFRGGGGLAVCMAHRNLEHHEPLVSGGACGLHGQRHIARNADRKLPPKLMLNDVRGCGVLYPAKRHRP
jgi:hypothetical protein